MVAVAMGYELYMGISLNQFYFIFVYFYSATRQVHSKNTKPPTNQNTEKIQPFFETHECRNNWDGTGEAEGCVFRFVLQGNLV